METPLHLNNEWRGSKCILDGMDSVTIDCGSFLLVPSNRHGRKVIPSSAAITMHRFISHASSSQTGRGTKCYCKTLQHFGWRCRYKHIWENSLLVLQAFPILTCCHHYAFFAWYRCNVNGRWRFLPWIVFFLCGSLYYTFGNGIGYCTSSIFNVDFLLDAFGCHGNDKHTIISQLTHTSLPCFSDCWFRNLQPVSHLRGCCLCLYV